ncbi:MAG: transglutaminase family protein [Actinobacteria bacterium]|nr:transglutaminase family protein [Actinomycetota bacterium]
MKLAVRHETRFTYAALVTHGLSEARVLPRETPTQAVLSAEMTVEPRPDDRSEYLDFFGNRVVHLAVARPHTVLMVTATAEVDVIPAVPSPAADEPWDATGRPQPELVQYVTGSPLVATDAGVAAYARESFQPGRPLREAVTDLTDRIHRDFVYQPGATTILTPVSEVMARRRGVCQDFAHLEIACLRSLGLPARYVSGHIETGRGGDGLVGAGASHAWCAVALPDGSWLDLDPTNRSVAPPAHVTVGWGRDYSDVAPLKGVVFTEGSHRLSVTVTVTRT